MKTKIVIILGVATIFACCSPSGTTAENNSPTLKNTPNSIIGRDGKGRAKVAEFKTQYGTCMSEVVYNLGQYPEIHVVIIKKGGIRKIGYLLIPYETEGTITDEKLTKYFNMIVEEYCLPLLLPGYQQI